MLQVRNVPSVGANPQKYQTLVPAKKKDLNRRIASPTYADMCVHL